MSARRYWRVSFDDNGAAISIEQVDLGSAPERSVVVHAATKEAALCKATKLYRSLLARERRASYRARGICQCGGARDRSRPDGGMFDQCRACHARELARRARAGGVDPEQARTESRRIVGLTCDKRPVFARHQSRLETLVEVRTQWVNAPNVGRFGKWLEREIEALAKGTHAEAAE